ncbi:uncharacterized protein C1orf131-like [Xenopus laevis]|uniref:Uncharacterized protein C1orf131-like n=1 Tax=Xenopus laevis TaxID=8355 RepID=A0A8J0VB28_XENLA|nr:uncharacterized protein C1orf131-like [Xenopus laevis]
MAERDLSMTNQLDSVLSALYDFGDDTVPRKKKKTQSVQKIQENPAAPISNESEKVDLELNVAVPTTCSNHRKRNVSMFFDSLKEELYDKTDSKEVPSTVATSNQCSENNIEVVTFRSRKKIKSQIEPESISETVLEDKEREENVQNGQTFNFEKARLEIHKFGITGYRKEKQRTFEQERAIMLGAKPPKKEYLHYKLYQEKLKEKEKIKQEESTREKTLDPSKKKQRRRQESKKPKKGSSSGAIVPAGQVGRFKNGALILSSLDIKKIKQSKFRK